MPSLDESIEAFNLLFKLRQADADLAAFNINESDVKNKRTSPRYVRDDIVVVLCEASKFSNKEIFMGFVTLNDIATRGISFSCTHDLALQKKIILNLRFETGMIFKINGTVIYKIGKNPYQYGVKFDEDNHTLADHLLETQRKLVFK